MEEIGRIMELNGKEALVKIERHSACSKCTHKCNLASSTHESDEIKVKVNNPIGASKGQLVKLEMREEPLVLASLIVYLIPLLGLITGYFAGIWLAPTLGYRAGEGIGIIGSLVFLAISFIMVRIIDNLLGKKKNFHPWIKEILD